jgi:hypothetical protein
MADSPGAARRARVLFDSMAFENASSLEQAAGAAANVSRNA